MSPTWAQQDSSVGSQELLHSETAAWKPKISGKRQQHGSQESLQKGENAREGPGLRTRFGSEMTRAGHAQASAVLALIGQERSGPAEATVRRAVCCLPSCLLHRPVDCVQRYGACVKNKATLHCTCCGDKRCQRACGNVVPLSYVSLVL